MLALRPGCETCDTDLPANASKAMICSFECTFCSACAAGILQNVCPNCGGELVRRPVRPSAKIATAPTSTERVYRPLVGARLQAHAALVEKYRGIDPQQR